MNDLLVDEVDTVAVNGKRLQCHDVWLRVAPTAWELDVRTKEPEWFADSEHEVVIGRGFARRGRAYLNRSDGMRHTFVGTTPLT